MVRSTDRPAMTTAVDLGRKATKQTNKNSSASLKMILLSLDIKSSASLKTIYRVYTQTQVQRLRMLC